MHTLPRESSQHGFAARMKFGALEIDEVGREVRVSGRVISLKPREYSLLVALACNAGIAMSRERLLDLVWGFDFEGGDRTLDVHIHRIRTKIGDGEGGARVLHTLRRFGYKFAYNAERDADHRAEAQAFMQIRSKNNAVG